MQVDLVVRSDAFTKQGGDLLQAEAYSKELGKRGVDARLVAFSPTLQLRRRAVVHHLNVDRSFDFLTVARAAAAYGAPLVVSPIHHPASAMRALRRSQRGPTAAGAAALLPEHLREFAAFTRRAAAASELSLRRAGTAAPLLVGTSRRIGAALDGADRVVLLTEFEGRTLRSDFGWHGRNGTVVPNGAPGPLIDGRAGEAILVVGRIEPRKRQLEIATAAAKEQVRIGFIGAVNPNARDYARRFEAVVASSPSLEWHGARTHAETVQRMRGARVVISFGWAEVQSLVEIEAAESGCFVVHNQDTGDRAWLGSRGVGLPAEAVRQAVRTAQQLTSHEPEPGWRWTSSWADAAETLEAIYREAGSGPAS